MKAQSAMAALRPMLSRFVAIGAAEKKKLVADTRTWMQALAYKVTEMEA